MNDFTEITYGLNLIRKAFSGSIGEKFRDVVDGIFPETINDAQELLSVWESDWEMETYIACLSVHEPSEDKNGRLSMWRAYGDVALVVNSKPFITEGGQNGLFSLPVSYWTADEYEERLAKTVDAIHENRAFLKSLGKDRLAHAIYGMSLLVAMGTKHPGFSEEQEWRIIHRPFESPKNVLRKKTVVLEGVAQEIYALPLEHIPGEGLFHADIPSLIDRIIIGPTDHAYINVRAFSGILDGLGVENANDKIVASDIPLRSN